MQGVRSVNMLLLYAVVGAVCSLGHVSAMSDQGLKGDGGCVLDKSEQDATECSLWSQLGDDIIVPENAMCHDIPEDVCMRCVKSVLVDTDCPDVVHERQKRGFFKKAFRSIGRPFRRGGFFRKIFRRPKPRVIPNRAPTITCPSIPAEITASPGKATAVVTWSQPQTADDRNSIKSVRQVAGKGSGSEFGEGRHVITYVVTDTGGLTASCSRAFTVKVVRCQKPVTAHGTVQCTGTVGLVYGSSCSIKCNVGYDQIGQLTATCQISGEYTALGSCQKSRCEKLALPPRAKAMTCTDGDRYESACSPTCDRGFLPARGAKAICTASKKWTQHSWKCEDTVKPVFVNCPKKKINTVDKTFSWEKIRATDNSGEVNVTQVQGQPSGSVLDYGVQIIKYLAKDSSGNTDDCVFILELKTWWFVCFCDPDGNASGSLRAPGSDCTRPTSSDPDMKFQCNGLTTQSVCHLSCGTGSYVEGSKFISCVTDDSLNNTSSWEPINGVEATCYRKSCPTLNPPKNGALACDQQLGGHFCQMQCDDRYDVALEDGNDATFICGENSQNWSPSNVVPDCLEMAFPEEYFLPSEFYYYIGDCSDGGVLREIKQQFLDNLKEAGLSPCLSAHQCSVDDVDITCGDAAEVDDFGLRRKKRAVPVGKKIIRIKLTFHIKNSNRTMSPQQAKNFMMSIAEQAKNTTKTGSAIRKMVAKTLPTSAPTSPRKFSGVAAYGKRLSIGRVGIAAAAAVATPPPPPPVQARSLIGQLAMNCSNGQVTMKNKPGACVSCSVGTYFNTFNKKCTPCWVGTYQGSPGSTFCRKCPPGHTTESTGTTSANYCIKLCDKDNFSPTGRVPCFPCPPGNYQPEVGATTCIPCPQATNKGNALKQCDATTETFQNATAVAPELMISDFLLTCDKEVCLSF